MDLIYPNLLYSVLEQEVGKLKEMIGKWLATKIVNSEEYKTNIERIYRRIDGATKNLQVCADIFIISRKYS